MRPFILLSFLLFPFGASMAAAEPVNPGFVRPGSSHTDYRTWTSQEGRTLLADLIEAKENEVVLSIYQGETVTVPVARLSSSDREYIARWLDRRSSGIGYYETGIFSREGLPESAHVQGVKHVAQRENYCATASAEMLLRFYGFD